MFETALPWDKKRGRWTYLFLLKEKGAYLNRNSNCLHLLWCEWAISSLAQVCRAGLSWLERCSLGGPPAAGGAGGSRTLVVDCYCLPGLPSRHSTGYCTGTAHWGKAAWNRPRLEDPSQEGEVFHSTEHLPYFSFNTKTTTTYYTYDSL